VYPFLPAIARGLNVSPATLSTLIAVRNLGGVATPVAARTAERYGRRRMMLLATVAVTIGCWATAMTGWLPIAALGIVLVGVAKPAFDISMQSWFGDRVPYEERGRVFGITELTWSVALAAVPLSAWLIERTSWRAPFVVVGLLGALGAAAVFRMIESDVPSERITRSLRLTGGRARVLGCTLLFCVAAEVPFIVYAQWLEGSFGLSVVGIGTFTIVIVLAELAGEGLVTVVADRWGLRRMVFGGLIVSALAYAAFSMASTLVVAVVVVTVWIAAFEVTVVAAIPYVSELAVDARERLLSFFAVMVSLGRGIGALIAQPLFSAGGIGRAGLFSAGCVVVAAMLLVGVREPEKPSSFHA
jgi:DHA1 family inner membrane transport protein